ncbi:MerR family transcriptional regulator [uncultured Aquincola sp.]|mgnify:CR=1 FL=1|uniref:MerR family transcriptional regulator n=1 Tax=uncultured Aquincola sp. TaxID=886556 RepID=UPI0032B22970|tara:strand:+ start:175 stop:1308 length:1134 start_codon:yes stop_codon:yes gene_type:complete
MKRPAPDPTPPAPSPASSGGGSLHRSGAVARMLQMPVATLRVWERRYGLSQPQRSASGQRLYSADEVRRLALLKQLTDRGHAIGQLAGLSMAQLQQVASTHASVLAEQRSAPIPAPLAATPRTAARRWQLAVVGPALAARLQAQMASTRWPLAVNLRGPFASLAQAQAAVAAEPVDAWLLEVPRLHPGWLAEQQAACPALRGAPCAVLYRYAADATCQALADTGLALLREPQPDAVLGPWLAGWLASQALREAEQAALTAAPALDLPAAPGPAGLPAPQAPIPARRWTDAALAEFAGLSTTIACECPRHVAELLMQLSHFEAYSAECADRGPSDAQLHTYLQRVAASARASFETALEQVALHEGLLPAPPAASAGQG